MATTIYADLATLKESLGVGVTDVADDNQLTKALNGASRAIDRVTDRRFWIDDAVSARVFRPERRTVRTPGGEHLLLVDDIATEVGLIVETGSAPTWAAVTGFETDPENAIVKGEPITGLLQPVGQWPCSRGQRVRVTAKWGWPAVHADIEQACLILARRLFHRKDSPAGVMGAQDWVVNLARRDPDVQSLIENFKLHGFG